MADIQETITNSKQLKKGALSSFDEAEQIADQFTGRIKAAADDAEERLKKYTDAAFDFAKQNPFYIAAGVTAAGLLAGALWYRSSSRAKPVKAKTASASKARKTRSRA